VTSLSIQVNTYAINRFGTICPRILSSLSEIEKKIESFLKVKNELILIVSNNSVEIIFGGEC
jgi:hypothetical protein